MTTQQQLQRTFDIVAMHLLMQAEKAENPSTRGCRYRFMKPDGAVLKCAVGCLIPDELYQSRIEGCGVTLETAHWRTRYAEEQILRGILESNGHDLELCSNLQQVHDHAHTSDWPARLREVAEQYELDTAAVDALEDQFKEKRRRAAHLLRETLNENA